MICKDSEGPITEKKFEILTTVEDSICLFLNRSPFELCTNEGFTEKSDVSSTV